MSAPKESVRVSVEWLALTASLTTSQLVAAGEIWRDLAARFPEIASGLLGGLAHDEIARGLRWDRRSLNKVLKTYVDWLRDYEILLPKGLGRTKKKKLKETSP